MADVRECAFVLVDGIPGSGSCLIESRDSDGATLAQYRGYFNFKSKMWSIYPHHSFAMIKLEKQLLPETRVRDGRR